MSDGEGQYHDDVAWTPVHHSGMPFSAMATAETKKGWLKSIYLSASRRIGEGIACLQVAESGARIPHVLGPREFPLSVTGWVRSAGSADESES